MAGGSHQTVRLARGRHKSPADGACVMELASMLAGERFSDSPRCVDPVIAAFLRAFNDRLPASRRQDLRPYAAAVVGSRGPRALRRTRRRACLAYAGGNRVHVALFVGLVAALRMTSGAPEWAARAAIDRDDIEGGFALLDELLALDGPRLEPPAFPLPVAPRPEVGVPAPAAELVVQAQVAHRQ